MRYKKSNGSIEFELQTLAKYAGQYIAFSGKRDEVLASAKTIKKLEEKLEKIPVTNIIIDYIPPLNVTLSLLCQS